MRETDRESRERQSLGMEERADVGVTQTGSKNVGMVTKKTLAPVFISSLGWNKQN